MFFWHRSAPAPTTNPIYGVNLGGWLVLEKWMTPSVFAGTDALDEFSLCSYGDDTVLSKILNHRETFISLQDFEWLRDHGITAVRLPIGYGLFGDEPPYLETVQYVDKAFAWAEATDIKILLDIHTAPGSQNGWQESGQRPKTHHEDFANTQSNLEALRLSAGITRD
jgi:glucan 1,3-beta-glucosidase